MLLHHSLGDNQDWPWWYEEVTGGLLVLTGQNGRKPSAVSTAAKLDIRPAAKHPILRNVTSFSLTNEQVYKGMWQSPKITPLLQTTHGGSDSTVAWIGVHPTARVVCIQPGTDRETHRIRPTGCSFGIRFCGRPGAFRGRAIQTQLWGGDYFIVDTQEFISRRLSLPPSGSVCRAHLGCSPDLRARLQFFRDPV